MTMGEMDEIKEAYESGKLDHVKTALENFIKTHKNEIKRLKNDKTISSRLGELSDEVAVKLFVLQHRSINPIEEIKEQLTEIEKEKWIQGIHYGCSPNPEQVTKEWANLYSSGWRDHRVLCVIYVFEREKERYLKLLE